MNGFYDPCIGEAKSLRVRYLFRDSLHEVTIDEIEALAIPRQCKLFYHVDLFSSIASKNTTPR